MKSLWPLLLLLLACRDRPIAAEKKEVADAAPLAPAPITDRFSEAGMLAEGVRYLESGDFRRATLVESLVNPKNTYSKQRLDSYGLKTRGWDLLPEWNPQSVAVTGPKPSIDPNVPRLWDGKRPTTMQGWVALGREVFFGYPLRTEVFMSYALEHPDVAKKTGVVADASGMYPGLRAFVDVHGKPSIGITCALCHSDVQDGKVIVGQARRAFDYGTLRLAYHAETKTFVDPDLARRMKTWGPGRADVTEDDDEDPVAIPDLWGLKDQTSLTQAGTIKHVGPTALVIRQETQLLHSNHQKIRPPRELAYALAMFIYSLTPPASTSAKNERGAALFAEHCKSCHSNPALGGPSLAAEVVGTDLALANGTARGTGKYRPPSLLNVGAAAPYFHHGAIPTLEDVLSPDRFVATYTRSPLVKKGAVPGHRYGVDLPAPDRDALVAHLKSL